MRKKILIVDDDARLRDRLARAFTDRGYLSLPTASIRETTELLKTQTADLAVIDLKMPGDSGMDLIPILKEQNPEIKIVMLTGYGSIATAVEAVRRGVANYLPKPADADEILRALQETDSTAISNEPSTPSLSRLEWEHINRVLEDCSGNISEAARRLGIHRRSLQRKLQKFAPR